MKQVASKANGNGTKGKHSMATACKTPKRAKPVDCIKTLHVESLTSISTRSISTVADNDNSQEQMKKKCKKCDGWANVFTIFNWVDPDNITKGYKCRLL